MRGGGREGERERGRERGHESERERERGHERERERERGHEREHMRERGREREREGRGKVGTISPQDGGSDCDRAPHPSIISGSCHVPFPSLKNALNPLFEAHAVDARTRCPVLLL